MREQEGPPDRRLLLGVAAFGLVFLVASAAVLALVLAARPEAPVFTPDKPEATHAVVSHPFWRVKVSRDDVLRMATAIQGAKASTIVYIDDSGKCATAEGHRSWGALDAHVHRPEEIGARYVAVRVGALYQTRPSLGQALGDLKKALDRRDFEGQATRGYP